MMHTHTHALQSARARTSPVVRSLTGPIAIRTSEFLDPVNG